jgi:hypothetical protein
MNDDREVKPVEPDASLAPACSVDGYEHCVTCSDEALQVRVLRVDEQAGLALVAGQGTTGDVDIRLVGDVAPGDTLLIHGGIAIGKV